MTTATPPMSRLALVELRKMIDTRAAILLFAVTGLATIGAVIAELLGSKGGGESLVQIQSTVGPIIALFLPILGILLVTSEWSQRTALTTFALVPRRERAIAAKLIAALVLATVAFSLSLGASAIGAAIDGGSLSPSAASLGRNALFHLLGVLGGFGLGLALMHTAIAVAAAFAGPLAIGLVSELSTGINKVTGWIDQAMFYELTQAPFPGGAGPKIATAAAVWVALPLAIGFLRLRRSEVK